MMDTTDTPSPEARRRDAFLNTIGDIDDAGSLLENAAALIETTGWRQGSAAGDSAERAVDILDPAACAFCAMAAARLIAWTANLGNRNLVTEALDALRDAVKDDVELPENAPAGRTLRMIDTILNWNDDPTRTAADVTLTLRTTAAKLREAAADA